MNTLKGFSTEYYKTLYILQDKVLEIINNLDVVECLRTFQFEKLSNIKWIKPVNIEKFKPDCDIIIENIITKSENKLFTEKTEI